MNDTGKQNNILSLLKIFIAIFLFLFYLLYMAVFSWIFTILEIPFLIILVILNKKEPEWLNKFRDIVFMGNHECSRRHEKVKPPPQKEYIIPQDERQKIAENITGLEIEYTRSYAYDSYNQHKTILWIDTPSERHEGANYIGHKEPDTAGICLGEWIKHYEPLKPWIIKVPSQLGLFYYNNEKQELHHI